MEQVLREATLGLVVTSRKSTYLRSLLEALQNQQLAPARIRIGVWDGDLPTDAIPEGLPATVVPIKASTFSAAITQLIDGDEPWLWLLHDDSAPEPGCLDELIRTGELSQKVGVVGPKQVRYRASDELLEVGIRATRSARRVEEIMPGEHDQGQLDWREDVLGVGSAGMLVRREALEAIGGLDTVLGPYEDGLETSRRMWLGGWRVVVQPRAVIRHAQATYRGGDPESFGHHRGAQIYHALLASRAPIFPLLFLAYMVAAPFRAFVRLLGKDGKGSSGELAGVGFVLTHIGGLLRGRRRLHKAQNVSSSVVRSLEDSAKTVRSHRREARRVVREAEWMAQLPDPLVLREQQELRAKTWHWGIAAVVLGLVVAAVGLLPVLGRGALTGGALLPDSWSAADLLRAAQYAWLPAGDGSPGGIDVLWVLLAPLALLSSLGVGVTALVLVAIPIAAFSAYVAAGTFTTSPSLRFLTASMWALTPPLLAAVSYGNVAAIVFHIFLLPCLAALTSHWRSRSFTSLGCAALCSVYLVAVAPIFVAVVLIVAGVGGAVRAPRLRWLWLPLPALAVVAPGLWRAAHSEAGWRWVLAVPGAPVPSTPSRLALLGLDPVGQSHEILALLPVVVVGLIGLVALVRHRGWLQIRGGWAIFGSGIAWAVLASTTSTSAISDGMGWIATSSWAGIGLSVAAAGLWLIAIGALSGLSEILGRHQFGLWQLASAAAVAALCLAIVPNAGMWAKSALTEDGLRIHAASDTVVPAVALANEKSDDRSRVLVLSPDDEGLHAAIWRGPGDQLHETSTRGGVTRLDAMGAEDVEFNAATNSLLAAIADIYTTGTISDVMSSHALSIVLVPPSDVSSRSALISALNSSADLEFVTENDSGAFWRLRATSARLQVVGADGQRTALPSGSLTARAAVSPGDPGRILQLAEVADPGWHAYLDGVELSPVPDTWNQQWELPATGGDVRITFDQWHYRVFVVLQGVLVLGAFLAAIPFARTRRKVR